MNIGAFYALINTTALLQETQIITCYHVVAGRKQPLFSSSSLFVCLFEKSEENPDLKGHIGLDHLSHDTSKIK